MSNVFSIEPEGMTRAWPIVPLISRKTRPTQNQAMTSRCSFCASEAFGSSSFLTVGLSDFFARLLFALQFSLHVPPSLASPQERRPSSCVRRVRGVAVAASLRTSSCTRSVG